MSVHWAHVTAGYALVVGSFAALALAALLRHGTAKRRLAALDPRAGRVPPDGRRAAWPGEGS